jgi:hypothetical protein
MLKLLTALAMLGGLAYLSIAAALFFAQTSIFFPARLVPPAGPLPARRRADRAHRARRRPPRRRADPTGPADRRSERVAILGFAGNASNAGRDRRILASIYPGIQSSPFHYRGYQPSGAGRARPPCWKTRRCSMIWFVSGSAPSGWWRSASASAAASPPGLPGKRPLDGLVLVTPFDSLRAVAAGQFPWLPVSLLIVTICSRRRTLSAADVPVALIAAERDQTVPAHHSAALARATRRVVHDVTIPWRHSQRHRLSPAFPGRNAPRAGSRPRRRGPSRALIPAAINGLRQPQPSGKHHLDSCSGCARLVRGERHCCIVVHS